MNNNIRVNLKRVAGGRYRVVESNGHIFVDTGEHRIFIVNVKEYKKSRWTENKDVILFEWVVKRDSGNDTWKEIYRSRRGIPLEDLRKVLEHDLFILEKFIRKDIEEQKSLFPDKLAVIGSKCGLNTKDENVQLALIKAYELGRKENSSNSNSVKNKTM